MNKQDIFGNIDLSKVVSNIQLVFYNSFKNQNKYLGRVLQKARWWVI